MNQKYQGKYCNNIFVLTMDSSGLGLTTVSHIVKSMGGNISVQSELGKGSTFSVKIPFKILDPSTHSTVVDSSSPTIGQPATSDDYEQDKRLKLQIQTQSKYLSSISSEDLSKKTTNESSGEAPILIAEDNPINRKVICKLVNSLGFKVDSACDGVELIDKFNVKQHQIVITDMVSLIILKPILSIVNRTCPI